MAAEGQASLLRYRAKGAGIDLYRAYLERRAADRNAHTARRGALIKRIEAGVPPNEFEAATSELIMLAVLAELDPIIADVLKVCERDTPKDDVLAELRSALRIGPGRTAHDAKLARQRERAIELWIAAYLEMERTHVPRSERSIATEIARELGVSLRAALNWWQQLKRAQPWQAAWAATVNWRARSHVAFMLRNARKAREKAYERKKSRHPDPPP